MSRWRETALTTTQDYRLARQMRHQMEPVHAVFYHAPEVFAEAAALGYEAAARRAELLRLARRREYPDPRPAAVAGLASISSSQLAGVFPCRPAAPAERNHRL